MHEGDAVDQLPGNEELLIPDDVIEVTLKPKDHKSKTAHDMPETKTIRISKLSDTRRDAVLRGKKMVSGLLSSHVQLVDRSMPDLGRAIAMTGAGRTKGELKGKTMHYAAVIFASSTFGESDSRPRYRLPPLNPDLLRQLLEAARGRFDGAIEGDRELDDGDMFLLFDGGRPGVECGLLQYFGAMTKARRVVHLVKDPVSVEARMDRSRNTHMATYNCMEIMHIITRTSPKDSGLKHRHYPGSFSSNVVGPVILPPHADNWNLRFGDKKLLYGKGIIRVGGKFDGPLGMEVDNDDVTEPALKRTDDTIEPVFFHPLPYLLWEDLALAMSWSAVIDLTASDCMLALACVKNGLPYCGVTFTSHHSELFNARLTKLVMEACVTEGDPLYDASFANALLGTSTKRPGSSSVDDPNKKPKTGETDPKPIAKKGAKSSVKKKEDKDKEDKDKEAKENDKSSVKRKDDKAKGTAKEEPKTKSKSKKRKTGKSITDDHDPFFSSSHESESGDSGSASDASHKS